jgi:hypothetical protein
MQEFTRLDDIALFHGSNPVRGELFGEILVDGIIFFESYVLFKKSVPSYQMKSIIMASLAVRRSRGTYFPTLLEHLSSDL